VGVNNVEVKVKVYAGPFFNLSAMDEDGYVSLKAGSTVNDLYKKLKVPFPIRPLMKSFVNYKPVKRDRKLIDDDIVSLLSIISGG
jgi:hypothetical protein